MVYVTLTVAVYEVAVVPLLAAVLVAVAVPLLVPVIVAEELIATGEGS